MSVRVAVTPRALFRIFATAEVVTWAGLIAALILRATGVTEEAVSVAGGIHGFVFLAYCAVTVFVWINQKWNAGLGILALALSIIPFATLPLELTIDKKGKLAGDWRLAKGGDEPAGFFEHIQAWILRRPILAICLVVILLAVVFSVLLFLGPPVQLS